MTHPDLADQLTLFQPGGRDYAHLITTGTPGFLDLPTALYLFQIIFFLVWNSTIDATNSLLILAKWKNLPPTSFLTFD